jgi:hypothetical protein
VVAGVAINAMGYYFAEPYLVKVVIMGYVRIEH